MKKMLFVMNPYAGTRRANRYLPEILSIFNRAGFQVTVHMTAGAGDCAQIVERLAPDMDTVVCAGGDGTLNEAVTGMLHCGRDIPIGYIPCGSTNDFASTLKLPSNVLQAARLIVSGTPVRYDVGSFSGRYFTYVASFGAFTRASYATPQNIKNALGHTAYLLSGIQELSQIHPEHLRIETGSRVIEDDFLFGAISNSTSVAGILTLDPKQVNLQDGKLELLLVRAPRSLQELNECILALQTQQYNCSAITFLSTQRLTVTAPQGMDWTLDGEREPGRSHIEIENLPLAIQLIQEAQPC